MHALVESKAASSNREAREFIKNGAISLNGIKVTDIDYKINKNDAYFKKFIIVKRGRRHNSLLIVK